MPIKLKKMKNALLEKSEIISCKEKIKGNSKKNDVRTSNACI